MKIENNPTHPFFATTYDLQGMVATKPAESPPDAFDFIYSPFFKPLFVADLPFSVVTDVVAFPTDVMHFIRKDQPAESLDTNYQQSEGDEPAADTSF